MSVFRSSILWAIVAFGGMAASASQAWAYHPKSPEVQQLIERALVYLKNEKTSDSRLGGQCIIALAIIKGEDTVNDVDARDHPQVQRAVAEVLETVKTKDLKTLGQHDASIYSLTTALILLCEVDPILHRESIEKMLNALMAVQKSGGGWGYATGSHSSTGDISQTQYGVLASWTARHKNIPVPVQSTERVLNYLLRVQDPSGGYGYQGIEAKGAPRVAQRDMTLGLTVAGLGSVYIAADLLNVTKSAKKKKEPESALTRVEKPEDKEKRAARSNKVNLAALQAVTGLGDQFVARTFNIEQKQWQLYYLYALERYQAFRYKAQGKLGSPETKEPKWYNTGVEWLKKEQREDGSWEGTSKVAPATAFGVLFLVRSSEKAIKKVVHEEGTLTAGRGLPKNLAHAKMKDGKIVTPPQETSIENILAALEEGDGLDFDPDAVVLDENVLDRDKLRTKLIAVVSDPDYTKRRFAVAQLAKARNFDNVPQLIYALTDPDDEVSKSARDGLRLLSRKLDGFGLKLPASEQQKRTAQAKWRLWYLSLKPDGELLQ